MLNLRKATETPLAKTSFQDRFNNVCIVMMSALGDAIHVLPVANALKRAAPQTSITWVVQPGPYKLLNHHPAIDRFVVFRRQSGLKIINDYRETWRELRQDRFDLVLNLQVYFKAGLLTAGIRADMKLGFDRARARDLNWLMTSHRIPAHEPQHVQDQYFEFLDYLGVDPLPLEWNLSITEQERQTQRRFFKDIQRPVCAVVMGSSKPRKDWAIERYARLLEIIESDFGYQPVLVGGPSAGEIEATLQVMHLTGANPINDVGAPLRQLVYVLDGAQIVVSPDTGPLHIARALQTPVIGLYGYTNPKRVGPYRKYEDLVVDGYARYVGENYPISIEYRSDGMERITVDSVVEKFELALAKYVYP
ncbi:MAG: glycosyltransferase family 9 protein [Pseudomonadota bacterium]